MSQNSTTSLFRPINSDNGDGDCNDTAPSSSTRLDKQVSSVSSIQKNATALKQSIPILDSIVATLDSIVFNGKRDAIAKLKGLKTSLLETAKALEINAVELSPIPGMAYAYSRKQTQEKRAVSPDTIQVAHTGKRRQSNRLKPPPPKRLKINDDVELEYPAPSMGTMYSPTEFVAIIRTNLKKHRGKLINHMVENNYVGIGQRALYKLLKRAKDPNYVIPLTWNAFGRKPLATEAEVREVTSSLNDRLGSSLGTVDMANALMQLKRKRFVLECNFLRE